MKTRRHYPECPLACCPNGVVQGSVLQGMVRTPVKRVSGAGQSQPVASFLTVNSVIRRRASFSGRSRSGSVRASAASRRCRCGSHRNLGGEHLPALAFPQDHHLGRSQVQLSISDSEVDPVCGVEVDPVATIESIEHEGVTCLGARWGPARAPGEASSRTNARADHQRKCRPIGYSASLQCGYTDSMSEAMAQISRRGTITLPAEVRKRLGLEEGDVLTVRLSGRSIVLTPAVLTPIELYSDERIAEFEQGARLTEHELAAAQRAWGSTRRRSR